MMKRENRNKRDQNKAADLPKKKQGILHGIKRAGCLLAIIGLGLCSLGLAIMTIINILVKRTTEHQIITVEQWEEDGFDELADWEGDCILVLGAGVRENGSPSLMLSDRLNTAIALYEAGVSDRLLMSGDHGRVDYDEVNVMKGIAMEAGVTSEHIFMDHAGFSTYDSLYRARDIFQADRVIIVSQQYHLYRALYIARALGIEAVGVAAPGETYYGQSYREVREMAARTKDFFLTIVKPEASIMGEPIPVSGNGDLTND